MDAMTLAGALLEGIPKLEGLSKLDRLSAEGSGGATGAASSATGEGEFGPCVVCGDEASGKHYGVMTCNGCKGFFRRSVRADRPYVCRANNDCPIDRMARNGCRACRFTRCLAVGMDVEAIRPDRDKTGRRNSNPPAQVAPGVVSAVAATAVPALSLHEALLGSLKREVKPEPDDVESMPPLKKRSSPAITVTAPLSLPSVANEMHVLLTLKKCDDQLLAMAEDSATPSTSSGSVALSEALSQSTLISPRIPFKTTPDGSVASCRELADNARGLLGKLIDYVNVLRPVADFPAEEKLAIIKTAAPAFLTAQTLFHSARAGAPSHSIVLPYGQTVSRSVSILDMAEEEDSKGHVSVQMQADAAKNALIDEAAPLIQELSLSEMEESMVRALIVLEPLQALSAESRMLVSTARDSVLEALMAHVGGRALLALPSGGNSNGKDAQVRGMRIALLIASLQRWGSGAASALQRARDAGLDVDSVLKDFLLSIF